MCVCVCIVYWPIIATALTTSFLTEPTSTRLWGGNFATTGTSSLNSFQNTHAVNFAACSSQPITIG